MLWTEYSRGLVSGEHVAVERFRRLLEATGGDPRRARSLGRAYLEELSQKGDVLPGARRALRRLQRRYKLAIVTNGYERVQRSRLEAAALTRYFDAVVTSQGSGFTKPHPGIVRAALRALGVPRREALFVGDDLRTDQGAAARARVSFAWIHDGGRPPSGRRLPARRFRSLAELADALDRRA